MSLDGIVLRVLVNRGRVEMRMGHCREEVSAEDARALAAQLLRMAEDIAPTRASTAGKVHARMLQQLEQAANLSLPCPSNQQLADWLQLSSAARASEIVVELEKRGIVAVTHDNGRQVTICKTGKRTAPKLRCEHHAA